MNWDDLRYVLAIAREGTLLRAAKALGVAHTTASRRLSQLEAQLGVRLFDRTPDGLMPTAAGEDLAQAAERMEGEALSVEGRVLGQDAKLKGDLRVSTTDAIFLAFEEAFTSFMARFPAIDLTLATSNTPVSLTRREADVVIRLSNAPPEELVGRKIGPVQFGIYASNALADRLGAEATLSDYPWLGWDQRQARRWFDQWLAAHAPGARIVLRIGDQAPVMAHAIRAGIGAQILPCFVGDPDPELRRIAPLEELFRLDLWVLTLAELKSNSRIRAFVSHIAEALGRHRATLAGVPP